MGGETFHQGWNPLDPSNRRAQASRQSRVLANTVFRVSGFGFRVSGFGFRGLELRHAVFWVDGLGFRVQGTGFRVSGFGF